MTLKDVIIRCLIAVGAVLGYMACRSEDGRSARLERVSPATSFVTGRISDEMGRPIRRANVLLHSNSSRLTATSGAVGTYLFGNVPRGSYLITASAPGFASRSGPLEVSLFETHADLTLQLEVPDE